MNLVRTALAVAASALLLCGAAFAGDDDAKDKRDKILDTIEKKLAVERERIREEVEKIVDEELARGATKPAPKKEEKKAEAGKRGYLGVYLEDAENGGASVAEVVEGSPAAKAGLKSGDVILTLNGRKAEGSRGVTAAVGQEKPGNELKLEVQRGKDHVNLTVKLGTRSEEAVANFPNDGDEEKADEGKDQGKKNPSADDLRDRIKKFMQKMGDDSGKQAKKDHGKKNAKDLLDESLDGKEKKEAREKDEDEDNAKGPGDTQDIGKMLQKFMEELQKGQKGGGDEGEENGGGQDDPMAGIMKWLQSEEGQKLMEQLQPLAEKLMQDENVQKLLEQLQQGVNPGGNDDEDKGEERTQPDKHEKPSPKGTAKAEKPSGAYLGLSPGELSDDLRDQLDLKGGVVVGDVVAEGPAAKAGLKKNDIITAIDGTEIAGPADVRKALSSRKPGDSVELSILRKGKKKTITVELGKKGAMAPSGRGDRRQAALDGALKDLAHLQLEDPSAALKQASEDYDQALQLVTPKGGKREKRAEQDPARWIQQMGQMAKGFAAKQELYWSVTDKNGKVLWRQRLEPDKMIELGARLGQSEAEHAMKDPRTELPRMGQELRDALRQQAELRGPKMEKQLGEALQKALKRLEDGGCGH